MSLSATLRGFAAASALFPAVVFAQETATDTESEIIVTAPLEGSRIESLQGAEVLSREDVIARLNGGLGDTLDATPGISTTSFGAGASRPIIRGLGEDRVRVLQNGIGAIDASTASPDHAVTSDGLDAERIEVLRGAAALAYGGNAIGGVVNVIDQSIPMRAVDGVRVEGLVSSSSVDDGLNGAGNVRFNTGPLVFDLGAIARETDPYETPRGVALNQYTDMRAYGGGASFVGDWGYAGVAVKRTGDEYGLLPEDPAEPGGHIELEQTRIESRGDLRLSSGPFDRLDYGVQHSDYEHTEFEGSGVAGTRFTSEGWEGRVEAHHRGERLQGAIGAQHSDVNFAAHGEEAFITATNTQDSGVFIVERWNVGTHWGLEGGLRWEQRELVNATFGARSFDNLSSSLGVFVRPAEGWFFGATLGQTERAPTAFELFSDGPHLATANYEAGNPSLAQETALSFEASARYQREGWEFEANMFGIEFSDYIALVARGDIFWSDELTGTSGFAPDEFDLGIPADAMILPVFAFAQRDATFFGGEIMVRKHLFVAGDFAISADAALDIVNAQFDGGGHPPRIPPRTLRLGVEAESETWTTRLEAADTASQERLAAFETRTEGYVFVNASLAFRPGGADGAWSVRLDGRNLGDEEGRVHASFLKDDLLLPGRNLRLTLRVEY